jgi:four helix bundle protein
MFCRAKAIIIKTKSISYRNLEVWKKAIRLARVIYELTNNFPKLEEYGLTSQIRRSAISLASNIAEGQVRNSKKEFLYFLNVGLGSLAELETQLIIAQEISYISLERLEMVLGTTDEITRMIKGLIKHLKSRKPATNSTQNSKLKTRNSR